MEIGTEISQKIRSAIKAKLIELGAYVDDELPDYIMVMVANKKTQQQMTDDLNLFLNVHTETFTTWLHSLLRKLQSINTDQPILSDEPPGKDKDKAKSKEKHKGEKKKRVHSDKADKAHSGKLQSEKARVEKSHSEKSHSEKTHSSKSHAEKPHSSKSHSERTRTTKSHSAKAHAGKSQSEKLHPEKSHTERHRKSSESSKQKRSSSKEQPKAEPESAPPPPTEEAVKSGDDEASSDKPTTTEPTVEAVTVETEEIKDEINITENTDEFAEEVKEEKVKKRTRSKSPTPKVTPAAKADKHSDAKKAKKSSSAKVSSRKKEERKDPVSKSKPEVEKRKRSPSSSSDSKKQPSSVVGIHKRRYEELEVEEESYDPMNPAVGNVASGIRVPARKSSVPKSLQANRSLLMKAVTEAERSVAIGKQVSDKSVKKSRRKRSPEVRSQNLTGRMKTAAGLQLISKSRRQEMLQKMTYTVDNESPAKTDEGRTDDSDSRDSIPNLKYTVKNEPAETSPKSKAISKAMAPSRVAASALKEISKNVVKDQHTTEVAGSDDEEYGPPVPDSRRVNLQKKKVLPESEVSDRDHDVLVTVDIKEEPTDRTEVSPSGTSDDAVADPEIQKILAEATEGNFDLTENIGRLYYAEDNKRVINKEKWTPSPTDDDDLDLEEDTRFIVTLDGVHPETMESVPELKQTVRQQAVKPMPKADSPSEDSQPAKDLAMDYSKMQPPKIKPFNISLKDSDDEGEPGEEEMQAESAPDPDQTDDPVKQTSILERCRFWPACANGNSCQYVHPTVPCKTFPYCKFGDKCMYIHPNCKYDAKCTRHDCPFTHTSKHSGHVSTVIHKYMPMSVQPTMPTFPTFPTVGMTGGMYPPEGGGYQPASSHGYTSDGLQCKFYPNCSNMNCPFVHPKPCRFGMGCRNTSCSFYHPPVPTKEKLKWFKETSRSSAAIFESLPE